MKHKSILISFLIIIVLLIVGTLWYQNQAVKSSEAGTTSGEGSTTSDVVATEGTEGVTCHRGDQYFVAVKARGESVGSDFLIKESAHVASGTCAWTPRTGGYKITDEPSAYFLALLGPYLILDSGTAPAPRELIVYNLKSQKKVFTDQYGRPVTTGKGTVTYWSVANGVVTEENCPDLSKYEKNGLRGVLEEKVKLQLQSQEKEPLGEVRCEAAQ